MCCAKSFASDLRKPWRSYLFSPEGHGPAVSVGLDAADVVGSGSAQNLHQVLQGALQEQTQGSAGLLLLLRDLPPTPWSCSGQGWLYRLSVTAQNPLCGCISSNC